MEKRLGFMKIIKIHSACWQSWCNSCNRLFNDSDIFANNRKCPNCGAEDWSDC